MIAALIRTPEFELLLRIYVFAREWRRCNREAVRR